jgi:hypothetical protein
MTIERAELTMPSGLLASLRHPEPTSDVTIVATDIEILEVTPGDSTSQVVTFELEDAVPVADDDVRVDLEDDEMAVVIEAANREQPLVGVVEAPDS